MNKRQIQAELTNHAAFIAIHERLAQLHSLSSQCSSYEEFIDALDKAGLSTGEPTRDQIKVIAESSLDFFVRYPEWLILLHRQLYDAASAKALWALRNYRRETA